MHPAEHQREKEDCVAADMHMLPVILDHDRILLVLRGFTIMGGRILLCSEMSAATREFPDLLPLF